VVSLVVSVIVSIIVSRIVLLPNCLTEVSLRQ